MVDQAGARSLRRDRHPQGCRRQVGSLRHRPADNLAAEEVHRVGTDVLNNAFASLSRDRPLHKIYHDQGNHRRCNDDVSQPVEMPERTVGILCDERGGEHGAEPATPNCAAEILSAGMMMAPSGDMIMKSM